MFLLIYVLQHGFYLSPILYVWPTVSIFVFMAVPVHLAYLPLTACLSCLDKPSSFLLHQSQ